MGDRILVATVMKGCGSSIPPSRRLFRYGRIQTEKKSFESRPSGGQPPAV